MQNKFIVYGIVGVVVVGGIVAFTLRKPSSSETQTPGGTTVATQNSASGEVTGSLKDLLAKGVAQKCTFSNAQGDTQMQGTVYVSNGAMRGDFSTVASGQTIQSHMIVKNQSAYVWSNLMAQGIKMSVANMTGQNTGSSGAKSNVDINQQFNYSCTGWSADQNQFALPANVTFSEFNAAGITGGATGGSDGSGASGNGNSAQCAACGYISDPAQKAQCKAALGCK